MTGPVVIVGPDTPQPPDWAYQAPEVFPGHPRQRYYRGLSRHAPSVQVMRWAGAPTAKLTVEVPGAQVQLELDAAELTRLRDAINDAMVDIYADATEAERQASLDRISEELRDAGEHGTGCYYAHPDVHYVPPGQVQAKVAELEAAGATRYIVLPDPVAQAAAA